MRRCRAAFIPTEYNHLFNEIFKFHIIFVIIFNEHRPAIDSVVLRLLLRYAALCVCVCLCVVACDRF